MLADWRSASPMTEEAPDMTDDQPVLVVGGTGMLGGQVVTALLERGKKVRALGGWCFSRGGDPLARWFPK